jgi:hypothetical protein
MLSRAFAFFVLQGASTTGCSARAVAKVHSASSGVNELALPCLKMFCRREVSGKRAGVGLLCWTIHASTAAVVCEGGGSENKGNQKAG